MTAPYYEDESVTLYHGDCREIVPALQLTADLILTDPPYGETSLAWDTWPTGWPGLVSTSARSMWVFGSMRMFLNRRDEFAAWRLSQDVVWEKNTTGMNAGDRFSRCHEHALHWYRGEWSEVYRQPPRVPARTMRAGDVIARKAIGKGQVTGEMGAYRAVSDGKVIQRTVIQANSIQRGINSTTKPLAILEPLVTYGCPPGGTVLDVFAGSCSTLIAARVTGRRAIGIELREEQCEAAVLQLAQGDLFGGVA